MKRTATTWIWLSIGAAVATIALKSAAAAMSGSVGVLSDALESGVNLIAAIVTLLALRWSAAPPDAEHPFGHAKGELLAALFEGLLVLVAGLSIFAVAIDRAIHPVPLSSGVISAALTIVATVINGAVGFTLVRVGRSLKSSALEADGHHLMTDVWSSVGVLVGLGLSLVTGIRWFDPLSAAVVAVLVLRTGLTILKQAMVGLVDTQLAGRDAAAVEHALEPFRARGVEFTTLKSRVAGRHVFVHLTLRVPGKTSVFEAHQLADEVEQAVGGAFELAIVETHVEPIEGA